MRMLKIGGEGPLASVIGIGCMRISELTVPELAVLADTALDEGINLFDHADIYGGGVCEELFGRLLEQAPALRSRMIVQTKCGIRKGYYDLSKAHIINAAENSLRRLHTDYLDILLLHRPDTLMEPEEVAQAFDALYRDGKVRAFGVSNMNPMQIELLQAYTGHRILAAQMQFSAACSGLVDSGLHANIPSTRDGCDESVLEYCRLKGITIQTWSPLQYGLFQGVFLGSEKYPELNAKLGALAEKYGAEPAAIAIAWILRHPARMQVITGSKTPKRIHSMAAAAQVDMTRAEWYEIYRAAGNILP